MQKDPEHQRAVAAGPEHRLSGLQREKPPFDKKEVRQALSMAIDRRRDHQGRLPGRRPAGQEPDPADHVGLQRQGRRLPLRSRQGQGACWRQAGVTDADRHRPLVHAGAAPLQPGRQAHGRDDAGRSRQGRRQRQARHLRVGRVPQAPPERRGTRRPCSAGPATTATRTTSSSCSAAPAASRPPATSPSGATRTSTPTSRRPGRSPTRPSAPSSTARCR